MFVLKNSFRNEIVMAILSWVSQRALWLRRNQLSGEVLGHRGNVAKLNAVVYSSTEHGA